jgi:diacylglycerol kinase family enzyme
VSITRIAVTAHNGKTLGGGLSELRRTLADRGVAEIFWREVPKSRFAAKQVEKAIGRKVDVTFVWGGDGMVQQCVDVAAGTKATLAIIPAGTANLLASNLGIPKDLAAAVEIGFAGDRRRIDVGRLNGGALRRDGRCGLRRTLDRRRRRHLEGSLRPPRIHLDRGEEPAHEAVPREDHRRRIPLVQRSRELHPPSVRIKLDRKVPYELDGGDRKRVRKLRVEIEPAAVKICVPAAAS